LQAPFWAIKEHQRGVSKRLYAPRLPDPEKVRANTKLPDGWRALPVDKAVIHILAAMSEFGRDPILYYSYAFDHYLEVIFGRFDWVIELPVLEALHNVIFDIVK
jgi:hypothetical protein